MGHDLRALVVADVEDPLGDLRERGAADLPELLGARVRRRTPGLADDAHPRCAQGVGEGGRRRAGRVVGASLAGRLEAAVDHQRSDRADDVVGHVVAPPGGVVGRPGEQGVVEADPDPSAATERVGDLDGERRDVRPLGVGRRLLDVARRRRRRVGHVDGPAGEQRVAATHQDHLARGGPADDPGGEAVVRPERGQGGGHGEELRGRGGQVGVVRGAEVPDLRPRLERGHRADDVAPQVGVAQRVLHGRGHPSDPDRPRGGRVLVVGDGRPGRQVEPGRREHGLRLGHRVGRQPGQVALAPLEAVRGQSAGQQGEDQQRGHPVAYVTSAWFRPSRFAHRGHCARHCPQYFASAPRRSRWSRPDGVPRVEEETC